MDLGEASSNANVGGIGGPSAVVDPYYASTGEVHTGKSIVKKTLLAERELCHMEIVNGDSLIS